MVAMETKLEQEAIWFMASPILWALEATQSITILIIITMPKLKVSNHDTVCSFHNWLFSLLLNVVPTGGNSIQTGGNSVVGAGNSAYTGYNAINGGSDNNIGTGGNYVHGVLNTVGTGGNTIDNGKQLFQITQFIFLLFQLNYSNLFFLSRLLCSLLLSLNIDLCLHFLLVVMSNDLIILHCC